MQLDAKRCPPGTLGHVPPLDLSQYVWQMCDQGLLMQPSAILGEDRVWRKIVEDEAGDSHIEKGTPVFGDWQSAVRWKIEFDRQAAIVLIRQANKLLLEASVVEVVFNCQRAAAQSFSAGAFASVYSVAPADSAETGEA